MKVKFIVFYKNGLMQEYKYVAANEQDLETDLKGIEEIIEHAYKNDSPGYITIPISSDKKVFVNLKETVTIEIQKL